jgi:hypothetical protein
MRKLKLTVLITPELAALVIARARRQQRGLSNAVTADLCRAHRQPIPYPDRPYAADARFTRHPIQPPDPRPEQ